MLQKDLAKKLNCTAAAISKYELEQARLEPKMISALCDIFGCTADYLLCRASTPSTEVTNEEKAAIAAALAEKAAKEAAEAAE